MPHQHWPGTTDLICPKISRLPSNARRHKSLLCVISFFNAISYLLPCTTICSSCQSLSVSGFLPSLWSMGNLEMVPTFPLLLQKKQENKTLSGKICLLLTVLLHVRGSKIKFSQILPIKRVTLHLLMRNRASLVMLHP